MKDQDVWKEGSLDPKDWSNFKELGQKMLHDLFEYVENVGDKRLWKPLDNKKLNQYQMSVPMDSQTLEQCYNDFYYDILEPNSPMNLHPGFWGWVMGCGNPIGVLAEMISAGLNSNVIGGHQISCKVEEQVLQWFKELFRFPSESSGIFTSGCSMANIIGLAVARNQAAGQMIKLLGIQNLPNKLVLYTSKERHSSIDKAVDLLGIGRKNLRIIPTDDQFKISIEALEEAIAEDLQNGLLPFCVVANVGTVNTGAVDDLEQISEICNKANLWLHVDGAFGALAALSDELKDRVRGLHLADSLAFDLHKWMYLPYGVGCVLVQNRQAHLEAFSSDGDYIVHKEAWFSDFGVELSRGFLALKVWMSLKAYGVRHFGQLIKKDVDHAAYLAKRVEINAHLELLAPVSLNIVCFRYAGKSLSDEKLNQLNKQIVMTLQLEGKVFPSETLINNRYAIRVAVTNYRSQTEHFDYLLERVTELGNRISK